MVEWASLNLTAISLRVYILRISNTSRINQIPHCYMKADASRVELGSGCSWNDASRICFALFCLMGWLLSSPFVVVVLLFLLVLFLFAFILPIVLSLVLRFAVNTVNVRVRVHRSICDPRTDFWCRAPGQSSEYSTSRQLGEGLLCVCLMSSSNQHLGVYRSYSQNPFFALKPSRFFPVSCLFFLFI